MRLRLDTIGVNPSGGPIDDEPIALVDLRGRRKLAIVSTHPRR